MVDRVNHRSLRAAVKLLKSFVVVTILFLPCCFQTALSFSLAGFPLLRYSLTRRMEKADSTENLLQERGFPVLSGFDKFPGGIGDSHMPGGKYLWQQNADTSYVFIPIAKEIGEADVFVTFEPDAVSIRIAKYDELILLVSDPIASERCQWSISSASGAKFIFLDLKKTLPSKTFYIYDGDDIEDGDEEDCITDKEEVKT